MSGISDFSDVGNVPNFSNVGNTIGQATTSTSTGTTNWGSIFGSTSSGANSNPLGTGILGFLNSFGSGDPTGGMLNNSQTASKGTGIGAWFEKYALTFVFVLLGIGLVLVGSVAISRGEGAHKSVGRLIRAT